MQDYSKELYEQLNELEELLAASEKNIRKFTRMPQGRMIVKGSHGYPQYYFQDSQTAQVRYMHSSEKKLITQLAQLDYERKLTTLLKRLTKNLGQFLSTYDVNSIQALYNNLCLARRSIVTPIFPNDEAFIEAWLEEHPGEQNPYPELGKYLTERGEFVRSKSEKIIADELYKANIPYQYESALELNGYNTIYPDFVVLNVKRRKTLYWEHFGLLDDLDYAQKGFRKIELYEKNGLYLGTDLILSTESSDESLNIYGIQEKIKLYLS